MRGQIHHLQMAYLLEMVICGFQVSLSENISREITPPTLWGMYLSSLSISILAAAPATFRRWRPCRLHTPKWWKPRADYLSSSQGTPFFGFDPVADGHQPSTTAAPQGAELVNEAGEWVRSASIAAGQRAGTLWLMMLRNGVFWMIEDTVLECFGCFIYISDGDVS